MATGLNHTIYISEESEYGILHENPVFTPLPHVATDIGLKKAIMLSEENRADRQIACMRHGVNDVSGSLATEICYGSFDTLLEGLFDGIWINGFLRPGITRKSYSLLRQFGDLGEGKKLILIKGAELKSLTLKITTNKFVEASFQVVGRSMELLEAAPENAVFIDYPENNPMDSFSGFVSEGGKLTGVVSEIGFTLDKNLSQRFVIGDKNCIRPGSHGAQCIGNITAYFEESGMLEKFIDESDSSIEFLIGSRNESYNFSFPSIKYTGASTNVQAISDIPLDLEFAAIFPLHEGYPVFISRCDLFTTAILFEFEEPVYVPDERGIVFKFDELLNKGCR